ncbi:MAG: preprotein translocase subunit SecE [Oligoflexus sp.]
MTKDDATWLRIAYVVFAGLVAFTLWRAADTVGVQTGWADRYNELYAPVSSLLALVLAAVITLLVGKQKERHDYFLAAIGELRKVSWPSMPDTRRMTIVVCVVVGVFAVILALFDLIWAKVLGLLLG